MFSRAPTFNAVHALLPVRPNVAHNPRAPFNGSGILLIASATVLVTSAMASIVGAADFNDAASVLPNALDSLPTMVSRLLNTPLLSPNAFMAVDQPEAIPEVKS